MVKPALAAAIATALLGCGRPANYVEAPELPEPATIEESEPSEPAPIDSDTAEETVSEDSESEAASPEPEPEAKPCRELPKGTCQVTAGCVWSTTENCIDE